MKKSMIRFLALMLAVGILLTGCAEKEIAGKVEAPVEAPQVSAEVQTEVPQEQTQPAAQENPLALGRMEGGTYTNPYAGFGCALDSSWTFLSAQELQQMPELVAGQLEGTELAENLDGYEQITDMMAENVELLCTVNVLYQKVSLQERAGILSMGEEKTIDMLVEQNSSIMKDSYGQMGIEVSKMERRERSFLGESRSVLYTEAITQGVPLYMVQLIDYSRGSYSVTTTFSSYVEDNTQAIMDLFFPVS